MSNLATQPIADIRPAPAEQIAQLRAIRALVDELAGNQPDAMVPVRHDLDRLYDRAPSVARERFNALAGETAAYAAAGLSALIAGRGSGGSVTGAAALLAREMARSIRRMETLLD
jgi:cysteine synthase